LLPADTYPGPPDKANGKDMREIPMDFLASRLAGMFSVEIARAFVILSFGMASVQPRDGRRSAERAY